MRTVVKCDEVGDAGSNSYKVTLDDGSTFVSAGGAYPIGAEVSDAVATNGGPVNEANDTPPVLTQSEIDRLVEDNAMLSRGLDEANATIASLSTENANLKREYEALQADRRGLRFPGGVMDVTPRKLDDIHRLDQIPPHETLDTSVGVETLDLSPGAQNFSDDEPVNTELEGAKT